MKRALIALCLALAASGAGCKSSEPDPQWIRAPVSAQDDRLLLDVTALALQKSGFPIGTGVDPNHLTVVSGWHNSLLPFRKTGYREQCEVRYERTAPRKYQVAIRVRHEVNEDIIAPLDLTHAEWVPEPDNVQRARSVMQHIRSLLDTDIQVGEKP